MFPKYQAILEDLQNEALVKLVQRIKDDETEKLDSVWNEVRSTWEGEEFRQGKSKVILKRKIENNHKLSGQLWAKYFKAVEYALEDSNIGPHDCEYDPRGSSEVNQSDECYKVGRISALSQYCFQRLIFCSLYSMFLQAHQGSKSWN